MRRSQRAEVNEMPAAATPTCRDATRYARSRCRRADIDFLETCHVSAAPTRARAAVLQSQR